MADCEKGGGEGDTLNLDCCIRLCWSQRRTAPHSSFLCLRHFGKMHPFAPHMAKDSTDARRNTNDGSPRGSMPAAGRQGRLQPQPTRNAHAVNSRYLARWQHSSERSPQPPRPSLPRSGQPMQSTRGPPRSRSHFGPSSLTCGQRAGDEAPRPQPPNARRQRPGEDQDDDGSGLPLDAEDDGG